jgi:hypothetical protein
MVDIPTTAGLIHGNIPKISSPRGSFGISSRGWGKAGLPIGLAARGVYFVVILFLGTWRKRRTTGAMLSAVASEGVHPGGKENRV